MFGHLIIYKEIQILIIMWLVKLENLKLVGFQFCRVEARIYCYTKFASITNRGSNHCPNDYHHHTITSTPRYSYNLRRGEIRYENNEVISRIVASIVSVFFWFSDERLVKSENFLAYNHHYPRRTIPQSFSSTASEELANKQANTLTTPYCFRGYMVLMN